MRAASRSRRSRSHRLGSPWVWSPRVTVLAPPAVPPPAVVRGVGVPDQFSWPCLWSASANASALPMPIALPGAELPGAALGGAP